MGPEVNRFTNYGPPSPDCQRWLRTRGLKLQAHTAFFQYRTLKNRISPLVFRQRVLKRRRQVTRMEELPQLGNDIAILEGRLRELEYGVEMENNQPVGVRGTQ